MKEKLTEEEALFAAGATSSPYLKRQNADNYINKQTQVLRNSSDGV